MADFTSAGQKSRNAGTGVYQYLDSNGDGSGTINLVGNYASAAAEFYYTNPNHTVQIERLIVNRFRTDERHQATGPRQQRQHPDRHHGRGTHPHQ
jgi:hypothetical protein